MAFQADFWPHLRGRLVGPTSLLSGICLLAIQVWLWQSTGYLFAWLIGMGIGLVITGAGYWFYYWDDRRQGEPFPIDNPDDIDIDNLNADEFNRRFEVLEDEASK